MKNHILLFFAIVFSLNHSHAQCINGIINRYTAVLEIGCNKQVLSVASASGFAVGDEVLIIQMQGASIDQSNTPNFGTPQVGSAGNYSFNRIEAIINNHIKLQFQLARAFDVAGKVQLVRVPEYDNVSACALSCQPWNGSTGGVLVLDVKQNLNLEGPVDVSGAGFRGGQLIEAQQGFYHVQGYVFASANQGGTKGEGIAIVQNSQRFGRGAIANGGGGGNAHNAGGGGGSNATRGGNGGLEYYNDPGSPTSETDGVGGWAVFAASPDKIGLGGGGGAGHSNDMLGTAGGNGGGIVIIRAGNLIAGNAWIRANGASVPSAGWRNDGQGGGGAGGTILLDLEQLSGSLQCEAQGGKGGDCLFYVASQIIGPGGGGAGGRLLLRENYPGLSADLSGGDKGLANGGTDNSAEAGQNGVKTENLQLFFDNTTLPDNAQLNLQLTPPECGALPNSGSIGVLSNVQGVLLNGNSPIGSNNTFNNLPSGSYQLTALLSNGCFVDTLVGLPEPSGIEQMLTTHRDSGCDSLGTITVLSHDGVGPFEYSLVGSTWRNQPHFEQLIPATYVAVVRDSRGCIGRDTITIAGNLPLEAFASAGNITCKHPGSIRIATQGGAGGLSYQLSGFAAQGSPQFSDVPAGSYQVLVRDQSGCTRTLGPLLVLTDTMAFHNVLDVNWCESPEYTLPDGRRVRESGQYPLVFQRHNGCDSTIVFKVEIAGEEYYVPNVFSPNGDKLNDGFTVYGNEACIAAIQVLRVFDRWGALIFEKRDFPVGEESLGWDGRAGLRDAPAGVYAYYCELRLHNGAVKKLSGDVTVVR